MFSKFVPTLSFPQVLSVFLFHVISKQLLCHLRRPFCVCESLSSTTFSMSRYICLAWSTKQTWKSCFCFFADGKKHKARELDMITLRKHHGLRTASNKHAKLIEVQRHITQQQIQGFTQEEGSPLCSGENEEKYLSSLMMKAFKQIWLELRGWWWGGGWYSDHSDSC